MKSISVLLLCAIVSVALAEPIPMRYRPNQRLRASARQSDGGVALHAELGDSSTEAAAPSDDDARSSVAPEVPPAQYVPPQGYLPQGWRPVGQLLVLPFAVRENVESSTTVESSTLNDDETTEQPTTTETQASQGQFKVERSEPKYKKTAPYKRPTVKLAGELKVLPKEANKQNPQDNSNEKSAESNESESTTTEMSDDATTTVDPKSENLETTSEPQSEAVDAENCDEGGQQVTNNQQPNQLQPQAPQVPQIALIQLAEGSYQRIVYLPQPTPNQAAFVPQPTNFQFQQLNQAPANYPFAVNPITNPRIVTFSSQYQAF